MAIAELEELLELVLEPARYAPVTKFPRTIIHGDQKPLKRGKWNFKIGDRVARGPLKGAPIFTLTLQERATCPPTCGQWNNCYGNHMPMATRHVVTPCLLVAIERQLEELCKKHERILIRLHVLGDFPSVSYVKFWAAMLSNFPGLHLYGYTHWRPNTLVGAAIQLHLNTSPSCRVLLSCDSEADLDVLTEGDAGYALVVKEWSETPKGFVKCPAELMKRRLQCADCALCFVKNGNDSICFREH